MNVVLFDEEEVWKQFLPFTFTKPICELRLGIFTLRQKWEANLEYPCTPLSKDYLKDKFPAELSEDNFFINSKLLPDANLVEAIMELNLNCALYADTTVLAYRGKKRNPDELKELKRINYTHAYNSIERVWHLFQKCGLGIVDDLGLITKKRKSQPLSNTVTVIGDKHLVYLEEGAKAEACIFNTTAGPIYIGKDAEIMEGSVVRGPFALGEHSALKLCTKIYGPTSIGPHCKVGGEVNNSVILGYSNKAHDGFLGNSVVGEWCNLGADTNNSNLKNNYANVNLYSYSLNKLENTGLQFCGLMMGDHSKTGINTMFNTGTVVGVGCNIFGGGFPPTHIPGFSWGGSEGLQDYKLEKLFETAEKVFERRGLVFGEQDKMILRSIKEGRIS
ncbi:MAG: GlmU family protein [Bacteroidia bacterium]|jgi:UDP-N-acetylglucosamine diphosphorylase/glucosamine-1-phosphate N-acetyltransferase|nr:GlmU family protein [Bacteroidia bacterium]